MSQITRSMFVIAVPDLAQSATWYRDVLGFEVREIGDPGWRIFQRGICEIMAGDCPGAPTAHATGNHSYFAYLDVDGIDAYYAEVVAAGAELIKPLRDEPWGRREFGVTTIDGHRIMFGAAIA